MKHHRIVLALAAASVMSSLAAPAFAVTPASIKPLQAPAKAAKKYTIEQFFATTRISGASFSADEKRILFSSDASGIFNAYTIDAAGGKPAALTQSTTDTTFGVSYFPDDDRILYTRDKGGDENNHLFVREADGTEKDLTPGDKLKASFAGWRTDGTAFYVTTNERDPKFFDFYRYDAKTYARTLLFKNENGMDVEDISRDEKWIALNKTNTSLDSDIYLYDVAKAETQTHHAAHGCCKSQRADL